MKTSRLLMVAVSTTLLLSACNNQQKKPSGEGGYIKEETEIVLWTTFNDTYQAVLNNCIAEFQEMEPLVTVKNVKQQGSYDDIKKMCVDGFAVDNYPDIVAVYPDSVAEFLQNAKGLDIQPYLEDAEIGWTEEDLDDIPEAYILAGQQYSVPGTFSLPACKSTEHKDAQKEREIVCEIYSICP